VSQFSETLFFLFEEPIDMLDQRQKLLRVLFNHGLGAQFHPQFTILHGQFEWRRDRVSFMDAGRKRVLLIAASILAARKLSQFDGGKRVPATVSIIADAVRWAEEIMKAIDERWSTK